jgi:carbonic anhydrase/acetyltransferase-like protein (isoleucine patch superfamily)
VFISHTGKKPNVHPSAYIAPTATLCGDVVIGPNCRIMHGVSIIAEGGNIVVGEKAKVHIDL